MPCNYDELIGTPFAYGGRDKTAFDCYGLVKHLYREEHGVEIADILSEKDHAIIHAMMSMEKELWKKVQYPKKGSVVLIKLAGLICHVGYVIDDLRFIHTWEKSGGVVIERLDTWKHRIVGFYEYDEEAHSK